MRETVYDINPSGQKQWFKIDATVVCYKCKKEVKGNIILDRSHLQVIDTSGFMIFEEIMCDSCSQYINNSFGDVVKLAAKELGYDLDALGIVDKTIERREN